jgi:hypothetical protein
MRFNALAATGAVSALILLAGCSGNGSSAISPNLPTTHAGVAHNLSTLVIPLKAQMLAKARRANQGVSHFSCPATGQIEYISDAINNEIDIYDSSLNLCGQITGLFSEPQGLAVHQGDLYVANTGFGDILRFHRGSTTPSRTYTDPSAQFPVDVTVLRDGTVVGSNIISQAGGPGSISTWHRNGTFVGNFTEPNLLESFFIVAMDNGTIVNDGFDTSGIPAIWSITCPGGACSGATDLGNALGFPGGLAESKSGDLVALDQSFGANSVNTFELPSLAAVTVPIGNSTSDNVDMDQTEVRPISQMFSGDAGNNAVNCFQYRQNGNVPGTCGSATGTGFPLGAAVDPGT